MTEIKERMLPGTALPYSDSSAKAFSRIELLISAAGGLGLSQVCSITGLEGSTIQNWVKRGWVSNPKGKKYNEHQIARILIINALKECLKLESIAQLMIYVNGNLSDTADDIISESELFNCLCEALMVLENADDYSQSGVEGVVDTIITETLEPVQTTRIKLRKALTVMIFACVCTDVKRRTEAMMNEINTEITGAKTKTQSPAIQEKADTENAVIGLTLPYEEEVVKETPVSRPWYFKKGS